MEVLLNQILLFLYFSSGFRQTKRSALAFVKPSVFTHDSGYSAYSCCDADIRKSNLHTLHTIVIIESRFVKNPFNTCRKNGVLPWFSKISSKLVVAGFANLKNATQYINRPAFTVSVNEGVALVCSYFFRLEAKKPRASLRISFAR